jgi:hypothetical protein
MTSPTVATMLEVFVCAERDILIEITLENGRNRPFVRADRNVPMHLIKPGLRHQDLEDIHLPSFRFSWKLKKLCRVNFFVFESWQTAEDIMVLPCDFTAVITNSDQIASINSNSNTLSIRIL